jgi:hypothetical protein
MTSNLELQVEVKIELKKNSEAFKTHLKKPIMISHRLVVLVGHDSDEL